MGMTVKTSKGREYLYFQAGKKSIYIGPKDDATKAKAENVLKALDYSQERVQHYLESLDEMLPLLPEPLRGQYILKRMATLQDRVAEYAVSAKQQDSAGQS